MPRRVAVVSGLLLLALSFVPWWGHGESAWTGPRHPGPAILLCVAAGWFLHRWWAVGGIALAAAVVAWDWHSGSAGLEPERYAWVLQDQGAGTAPAGVAGGYPLALVLMAVLLVAAVARWDR